MKHQEKKFRVDSFDDIRSQLLATGVKASESAESIHYYALRVDNDVTKLVVHDGVSAIHILEQVQGKFRLTDDIPMSSVLTGLQWLKAEGYSSVYVITMKHTDYVFQDGIVGLYIVNGMLRSVILDYPDGMHGAMERQLGLRDADVIEVPYNVYLKRKGLLTAVAIDSML